MDRPEYMPAAVARREILGVSEMTEWRWRNDPELDFPQSVKIRGLRYYRAEELREWFERQRRAA